MNERNERANGMEIRKRSKINHISGKAEEPTKPLGYRSHCSSTSDNACQSAKLISDRSSCNLNTSKCRRMSAGVHNPSLSSNSSCCVVHFGDERKCHRRFDNTQVSLLSCDDVRACSSFCRAHHRNWRVLEDSRRVNVVQNVQLENQLNKFNQRTVHQTIILLVVEC